jgi:hypothetical protein
LVDLKNFGLFAKIKEGVKKPRKRKRSRRSDVVLAYWRERQEKFDSDLVIVAISVVEIGKLYFVNRRTFARFRYGVPSSGKFVNDSARSTR